MKKMSGISLTILVMAVLWGCDLSAMVMPKRTETPRDSAAGARNLIEVFRFESAMNHALTRDYEATIAEDMIEINIEDNLADPDKNLIPTISAPGAVVSPRSGVLQSFKNPVTYTVVKDGKVEVYTVVLNAFSIDDGKILIESYRENAAQHARNIRPLGIMFQRDESRSTADDRYYTVGLSEGEYNYLGNKQFRLHFPVKKDHIYMTPNPENIPISLPTTIHLNKPGDPTIRIHLDKAKHHQGRIRRAFHRTTTGKKYAVEWNVQNGRIGVQSSAFTEGTPWGELRIELFPGERVRNAFGGAFQAVVVDDATNSVTFRSTAGTLVPQSDAASFETVDSANNRTNRYIIEIKNIPGIPEEVVRTRERHGRMPSRVVINGWSLDMYFDELSGYEFINYLEDGQVVAEPYRRVVIWDRKKDRHNQHHLLGANQGLIAHDRFVRGMWNPRTEERRRRWHFNRDLNPTNSHAFRIDQRIIITDTYRITGASQVLGFRNQETFESETRIVNDLEIGGVGNWASVSGSGWRYVIGRGGDTGTVVIGYDSEGHAMTITGTVMATTGRYLVIPGEPWVVATDAVYWNELLNGQRPNSFFSKDPESPEITPTYFPAFAGMRDYRERVFIDLQHPRP